MYRTSISSVISGFVLFALGVGFLCMSLLPMFSVSHSDMEHGSHVTSFAGQSLSDCCGSASNDHTDIWKSTFIGIFQNLQTLLVLFAVALVAFRFSDCFQFPLSGNDRIFAIRFRQYAREHPDILTYNPLRLAFARGILNPKLF